MPSLSTQRTTSTTGGSNLFLQPTSTTSGVSETSKYSSKFDKSNGYSSGTSSSLNSRYSSYIPSSTSSSSRYRSGSLSGGSISALSNYDSSASSALSSSRFGVSRSNSSSRYYGRSSSDRELNHSHHDYTLPKRTSSFSGQNNDTLDYNYTSTLRTRRNSLTRRPPSLYGGCSNSNTSSSSILSNHHQSVVNVDFNSNSSKKSNFNNQLPPLPSSSSTTTTTKSSTLRHTPSSLARYVATSGYDLYEKYSPAHYIPKCELLRSRSLSEANVDNNCHNLNNSNSNHNNSNHKDSSNHFNNTHSSSSNGTASNGSTTIYVNSSSEPLSTTSASSTTISTTYNDSNSNGSNNINIINDVDQKNGNGNHNHNHDVNNIDFNDLKISKTTISLKSSSPPPPSSPSLRRDNKDTKEFSSIQLANDSKQRERNVESIKGAIKQQQQKLFTSKLTSTNTLRNGNNGTTVSSTLNGTAAKLKDEFLKTEYELVRSQLVANKILEFENISNNNNNNNYQRCSSSAAALTKQQQNMNCLDDIKFIDSDEFAGPIPTRPKSSVLTKSSPSTLPLVNKKSTTASIDANSIKASINKFNTLSEMKRIPTRSSTGNLGSNSHHPNVRSHSHHHHHHNNYIINNNISSNIDNNNYCGSSGSSSCSEKNYKTTVTGATPTSSSTSSNATAAALKKQSMCGSSSGISCNSSKSASPQGSRKASASSIFATNATNLLKSTVICSASTKQQQQQQSSSTSTTPTPSTIPQLQQKSHANGTKTCDSTKKSELSSKKSDNDDSIRTTSIRTTLPPSSPTSSRYLDNSASTSSYKSSRKSTISESENGSPNGKPANGDSETSDEGLCGLRNIGNTCFMNSVIQCLSHTSELTKFLKTQTYIKNTTKDQQILHEFAKLIREMWTPNIGSVTPHELKSAFSSKHRMYSGYNQQDSQEFLRFFLDSLHCALNAGTKGEHLKIDDSLSDNRIADLTWEWYSKVESSIVKDLFVGQLKSALKCTVCGNTSVTFDPFWDLSVPLQSSSRCNLYSCLDLFIREEILDGDEKPTCSKCQTRRKCTKSFSLQRFPKYLVIHLKRFSETRWSKLSNVVEFPTGDGELNMAPYAAAGTPTNNTHYTLYAVSNHMGSTAGGHYTAYCKHPYTKRWHEFNDNIVSEISESSVVSSSAYLLFYERT